VTSLSRTLVWGTGIAALNFGCGNYCSTEIPARSFASHGSQVRRHLAPAQAPHAVWSVSADETAASSSQPSSLRRRKEQATSPLALGVMTIAAAAFGRSRLRTRMEAIRKKQHKAKKKDKPSKATSGQPKLLKQGYWQEGYDEDDVDVFEWFAGEEVEAETAALPSQLREVAAYTIEDGITERFTAPEYRTPPNKLQLQKGLKAPLPVDQDGSTFFAADMVKAVGDYSVASLDTEEAAEILAHADIVTSLDSLKILVAFLDGTMGQDMRAKGLNVARRRDAELIDLMRVTSMPEAPNAMVLATIWAWERTTTAQTLTIHNHNSYDSAWLRATTGQQINVQGGPRCVRVDKQRLNYRLISYDLCGLRIVVRAPTPATVPSVDGDAFDHLGQGVEVESANWRDAGELWSRTLPSHYAEMQLGDIGMVSRGVLDKGFLIELQEVTQEDLRLDRPGIAEEASQLCGRVATLLKKIRKVVDEPGCKDKPLYLQYANYELRLVTPRWPDDGLGDDDEDDFVMGGAGRGPAGNEEDMATAGEGEFRDRPVID